MLQAGNAFDQAVAAIVIIDTAARRLRIQRIFDVARDLITRQRAYGFRVQYFGAEIRQLHRLVVRQMVNQLGIFHLTRVRTINPIHVGPNFTNRSA